MPDTYIPLEQAAELEGVNYNTLIVRKNRNPEMFKIKTESTENGGKDRILIELSSLSIKAKRTFQARQEIQIRALIEEAESDDGDEDEAWYVGVDLNKYLKKYSDKFYKSVEMANRIKDYLEYKGDDKTGYTEMFAKRLGMSGRNFRRKVDKYLEGCAWAIEMNEQDKRNYDFYRILAICPRPREKRHIAFTDEMKAVIENIWFDKTFAANHRKQTKLYAIFQKLADSKGWVLLPSYPTVNRYINEISDKYSNEHFLADQGLREFKRKKMIKRRRDTGSLRVMELVQGDAHTFDCWVKITRNGHTTAIKPYLAALIDTRSRSLVGWAICEVPNSDVIKQVLMHMMYQKKNNPIEGVPRILLIDNGKDWTSQTLTGRNRKERVSLDGEIKGFFKSIGIEDDMRSLPYQAWTKGQIERFFGNVCGDFTSEFESYTGTLTGSKTIGKIKKDIKGMLEKDELLSIEEFAAKFDTWLNEEYHNRVHRGLKEQKEPNPMPINVYMEAERYYKAAPPMEYTRVLLMQCEERTVYSVGIKMDNGYYHNEELSRHIDKKVDIRFNINEPDLVHVYGKDGSKICEAKFYKGLNPLAERGNLELTDHMKNQKRQVRDTKDRLLYLQTPYEERNFVDNNSAYGKKLLKAERKVILPELTDETPKVVSMPDDRQYKDEVKNRKNKAKVENNEFFDKQYEKAMAKLG